MKKVATDTNDENINDEMKPEYDLRNLRVRRVGAARKNFGGALTHPKPDVAEVSLDTRAAFDKLKK
jgi:hypothetical protein